MNRTNEFISKFTDWYMISSNGTNREAFKFALRKAIFEELPNRKDCEIIQIRNMAIKNNYQVSFETNDFWVGNSDKDLFCSCLRPNWANGWSNFSKHKDFNHYFSGFFNFSSQYIARSYQINLIGALNLSYNTEADFRHTMLTELRKAKNERNFLSEKEMYKVKSNVINSYRHKQLVFWYDKMNALDPLINRTIFNLNRAIKLRETFLIEEIITALDKTMNVLEQYWKERVNAVDEIRKVMMRDLGFNENSVLIMQHLYELRCYFGAHPSHSKWWDISEIYEHDLDELYNIVIKVVMKVVLHENQHRKVIKCSDDWSEWFKEYCMILWKSVWFETIPPNFS